MSVLYVTSFAPDMFHATGAHLVDSFLATRTEGRMLVCHEGGLGPAVEERWPTVLNYDLDTSDFLRGWLEQHRDIVPVERGGTATPCECRTRDHDRHESGCHWDWYNRNADRWFRKVVSLDHAMRLGGWDYVVWVDADCRFVRSISIDVIRRVFDGSAMFYLRGADRKVIESGLIGFTRDTALLGHAIERFRSGRFRQDARWDDGYQFGLVVEEHPDLRSVDIATRSGPNDDVVPGSMLGHYLAHFKGIHGFVLRLMR